MTPSSKMMAGEYEQHVMKPKIAILEDIIDLDKIIKCDAFSYSVPKFKIVSVKLLGDILICDDVKSVSIIDANTMQKIRSIQLPHQATYLYSICKHEKSQTIFLGYANRTMTGFNAVTSASKSSIQLEQPCMSFTQFHADADYLILACEQATILIYNPVRNNVLATFKIEDYIRD